MGTRIIVSQQKTRVKSVNVVGASTTGAAANRLVELADVDASDADNNETLVYDSSSQKYIVKSLPAIDGGSY